jgi:hypothetical protein
LLQLQKEFDGLDVDHDGFISPEDLVIASKAPSGAILPGVNATLGCELSLEEAEQILNEVDTTRTGRISFEQVSWVGRGGGWVWEVKGEGGVGRGKERVGLGGEGAGGYFCVF